LSHREALKTNPGAINWNPWVGALFFVVGLIFVYRSFYCMRIPADKTSGK